MKGQSEASLAAQGGATSRAHNLTTTRPSTPKYWFLLFNSLLFIALLYRFVTPGVNDVNLETQKYHRTGSIPSYPCRHPMPTLLAKNPPSISHPAIGDAMGRLDAALSSRFSEGGIDSISMAVVTSAGSLHEGFWGVRRANETDEKIRGMVDRHSIYRLASISKLFTSLETFILRDRGVLDLDDPIHKVLPQFPYDPVQGPVTYRQLMSHMSGLGRDWPAGDASKSWPKSLDGSGPPGFNGLPFPSFETFMESFKHHDVVMPQYTYPVYCNTGFALLGLANVAANRLAEGDDAPKTHAELMRRDIFGPMGLNGSSFLATRANLDHVTVASINTTEITYDFKDPMNPAGGQMSSLSDLVKVMQTFLDPTRPENLISPYTLREWMRPLHKFWDGVTSVGALWEIYTLVDSYGRPQELYQKSGELAGYHLTFSMVPSTSYGVVVLTTGPTTETLPLNRLIFEQIQSAFDAVLEDAVRGLLVGTWHSSDARGTIAVTFDDGSLFVSEYTLNGTDVLQVMQADGASGAASEKVALWATAEDEYKLAASGGHVGCVSGWVNLDGLGYIDGVSVNLLRVKHDGPEIILELPAIAMEFRRA